MQIRIQPQDVILLKLQKIRCCAGCLNDINYLVFGHGLYCSQCLSTLPQVQADQFVNLESLAQILVKISTQHHERTKGPTSQLNLIKGQMESLKNEVKKIKDALVFDLKTVKDKSNARLDELFTQCLKQNKNQPLEQFYEPDITATIIVNEQQSLLKNLMNLRISRNSQGQIEYKLTQGNKDPTRVNNKVLKQYKELKACIQTSTKQVEGILENFYKQIAEQKQRSKN